MGIHWQELVIILVIALVIFGPRRLPEIGRSMGTSIREFKESFSGGSTSAPTPAKADAAAQVAVPVEAMTATPRPTEQPRDER